MQEGEGRQWEAASGAPEALTINNCCSPRPLTSSRNFELDFLAKGYIALPHFPRRRYPVMGGGGAVGDQQGFGWPAVPPCSTPASHLPACWISVLALPHLKSGDSDDAAAEN